MTGRSREMAIFSSVIARRENKMTSSRRSAVAALVVLGGLVAVPSAGVNMAPADDAATVASLDTQYQAAVKANDAATMDRILADDFVLVTGRGQTFTKTDLLRDARNKTSIYEHQEELEQKVRMWGDTAVVTALLWIKGISGDKPFERKLWFSDTYVRTAKGWRYVLGQASLPLP
jgi:ketosteroid isomerase-like protein